MALLLDKECAILSAAGDRRSNRLSDTTESESSSSSSNGDIGTIDAAVAIATAAAISASSSKLHEVFNRSDTDESEQAAGTYFHFTAVDAVDIAVRDLTTRVIKTKLFRKKNTDDGHEEDIEATVHEKKAKEKKLVSKTILDNVSLDVPCGSLMAIIGGSGSGKTSLLNAMADRVSSAKMSVSGSITFNGHTSVHRIRHAYVIQQDILLPSLTCRETLMYSADLRLPSSVSKAERRQLVEEVILELGLKECADTIVGDTMHKGLSGGEKRRLSIGIQLLKNPSVLFLDEPTTGLDAFSAQLLVQTLHNLARRGRTLIMSIHQPRADIFFSFDSITLLSHGQVLYAGPVEQSLTHFASHGFSVPDRMNPADYLIDIAVVDTRSHDLEEISRDRVARLAAIWTQAKSFAPVDLRPAPPALKDSRANLVREIAILTSRIWKISMRDPLELGSFLIEAIVLGVMCGWIFYDLQPTTAGIRSTLGALYSCNSMQGYVILLYETYRLCAVDMKVFDREYQDGMVTIPGFIISRRLAKLLTEDLFTPLFFSVTSYFMMGLTRTAYHFFIYFLNNLLQHYCAVCAALFCVSISRDYASASFVSNMIYTVQSMGSGYFNQVNTVPVYVRWIKWVAYLYYGFAALVSNQFTNYFGDCPYGDASNVECVQYTGAYILESIAIPQHWIALPLGIVLAYSVGYYLVGAFFLKIKPTDISTATASSQIAYAQGDATDGVYVPSAIPHPIAVDLFDLHLVISKPHLSLKQKEIEILRGITAHFEPGKVNAILGPSGSGKSSLLNYIALRLHSSLLSRYASSGSVLFAGQEPSPSVLASICSYVTQEDDGLLGTLTVRETLRVAAELRLPRNLSKAQRQARVEDVIFKMGLRDCADTLVGDELLKGISGGEKRRLSICIQLLNEPKVLLLDEPTSGLDSFTAASTLKVLKGLADEGRTVICTIHQPRSDLFPFFGNVLLLAKGGKVVYSGPGRDTVLEYFDDAGFKCPAHTNPADHLLDLVSVNLQDMTSETVTRQRVDKLIERHETHETSKAAQAQVAKIRKETTPVELGSLSRKSAPFARTLPILMWRGYLNMIRKPTIIIARLGQILGFGIILALFYSPLKSDYYGALNRYGLVQQCAGLYFIGMLNNLAVYPSERDIFYREHDDGVYGVLPFVVNYLIFELPTEILNGLIFSALMVMVTGMHRDVGVFFVVAYGTLTIVNCGESIGIVFNTMFRTTGFAATMTSLVLTIGATMNGLFSLEMMGFLRGINYINPLKYSMTVILNYALDGLHFTCSDAVRLSDGSCPFDTGEELLKEYGVNVNKKGFLWAMFGCIMGYRLVACLFLKLVRLKLNVAR
ncbi:P-loop containing nucleoside triphosphate hydrolase protein [Limtongia smithiae]|uniref:P-loop containing nucleoside triphosphate hydrolase protein n=1 Tax=Limtongia smithiae TaxID=1125753 RepID=UPI0034CD32A8